MVNTQAFPKRLKQLMAYYDLNASSFSDTIDFNRSTISHLLSGRNKPSLEFVMKILHKFPEVNIDWLVDGKGDFPSNQEKLQFHEEETPKSNPPPIQEELLEEEAKAIYEKIPSSLKQDLSKQRDDLVSSKKEIAKIVIFYTDSSFEAYEN